MLESKFLETVNYAALDQRNYSVFSNEYAMLLQAIGAELDNFFKVYCGFASSDRKNISDYAAFLMKDFPTITSESVKLLGSDIWVTPFQGWTTTASAQSLPWWQAFDNVKHNRTDNFSDANQGNVLNMLAALYLLELKMYTKATTDKPPYDLAPFDVPTDDSKVFMLPKWKFRCLEMTDELIEEMEI